ncbi:MAG: hypothetical protein C0412_04400 [Flavobacterium sp.]|nr:hypothetical protein [Flavobacterium sp.]
MTCIKMYPSLGGDAFLIKKPGQNATNILIDGGFATTFQEYILPDLRNIKAEGNSLDLVVATHIDADHIAGLIKFFEVNGDSSKPSIIGINEVWHNTLRSIKNKSTLLEKMLDADKELITEICRMGISSSSQSQIAPEEISARQGSSLGALLLKNHYKWNGKEGFSSINSQSYSSFEVSPNVRLRVLGPSKERLEQLYKHWFNDLQRLGFASKISNDSIFDDAFEFLCSMQSQANSVGEQTELSSPNEKRLNEIYISDQSITNGSSISMIIEIGKSKLLFLGDSWTEDIIDELKNFKDQEFPILFDAIKVSHHGSYCNTSPALLELIDSPVFLVSSNGQIHGHPSEEVIKAIVDRDADFHRDIHFNYSTSTSRRMNKYESKSNSSFAIHENSTNWLNIGVQDL